MKPVFMKKGDEVVRVQPTTERERDEQVRLLRKQGFRESGSPGTKRVRRVQEVHRLRD